MPGSPLLSKSYLWVEIRYGSQSIQIQPQSREQRPVYFFEQAVVKIMPGGIRLSRLGQDVGHFLGSLAGIRKASRRSCRQNARPQRRRIRRGGPKNRLIGNVRDDLAP